MSAADREVRSAQTAGERARPTSAAAGGGDAAAEAAGLAERLEAYGAALCDVARAVADELSEQAS
jgi:hypothetical protein